MTKQARTAAWTLLGAVTLTALAPLEALAGKKGRRNTAIVLGAVAAYGVVKKKPVVAGVAGAGAVYSYVRSQKADEKKKPRRVRRGRYVRPKAVHVVHKHGRGCGHRGYEHLDRIPAGHLPPPEYRRGYKNVPPGHLPPPEYR